MTSTEEQQPQNPFESLIDELESSLKTFVGFYNPELIDHKTNQELAKKNGQILSEHLKQTFDQNAQELYEKANNLELMLVRSRLEISKSSPEQVLQEVVEIQCLRAELKRKEDLLADTKEKVAQHENFLKSMIN